MGLLPPLPHRCFGFRLLPGWGAWGGRRVGGRFESGRWWGGRLAGWNHPRHRLVSASAASSRSCLRQGTAPPSAFVRCPTAARPARPAPIANGATRTPATTAARRTSSGCANGGLPTRAIAAAKSAKSLLRRYKISSPLKWLPISHLQRMRRLLQAISPLEQPLTIPVTPRGTRRRYKISSTRKILWCWDLSMSSAVGRYKRASFLLPADS